MLGHLDVLAGDESLLLRLQDLIVHHLKLLARQHLVVELGVEPEFDKVREQLIRDVLVLVVDQAARVEMKQAFLQKQGRLQFVVGVSLVEALSVDIDYEG